MGIASASAAGVSPENVPPGVTTYEVAPGDTLSGIAQSFGITPDTILWANQLSSGDLIRVGQKLTILPVSGVLHQVKAGESVEGIASIYGVDPSKIVEINQISDPTLVHEGDLLIVPGGTPGATAGNPGGGSSAQQASQYTVKPGDTLSSIAAAFGVDVSALQSANGLSDAGMLGIGQLLSIPGGQPSGNGQGTAPANGAAPTREPSSRGTQTGGRSFIANVTAYTIQGRTATGSHTHWGAVAVDPAVVPLGSKIRIDGFNDTFVAEDTCGGVRGNWIDIWFPDFGSALRFGMQSRRVTIVEP